jgi:hypothetical protein
LKENARRCIAMLLKAGGDPNQVWSLQAEHPLSALYGAAGRNHDPEMTAMLLAAGANPNDGESLIIQWNPAISPAPLGLRTAQTSLLATLNEIRGKDVVGHLWRVGTRLKEETNRVIENNHISDFVACIGLPPWTGLRFRDTQGNDSIVLRSLFQQEVLKRGLLTHGNHMLTFSIDETVIDETLRIYAEAFEILADAIRAGQAEQRLEGTPMQTILREV